MGRQQSGSPNRLNQSRQRESVPPLYFTPDTLTAVLDVEIEQENLPPAYSTVADENHITEVAELAPAEPSSTKAKESYPTLQYSPVVVTEESRLAGPSREKNDRTYCPTPRYSPVFDTEESRLAAPSREKDSRIYYPTPRYSPVFNTGESRLAAPSREKTNKIYYPTPRYSVVFDDGNSAIPNSEEAESRSAGLLIKKGIMRRW
ncbi:hypothetical protein BDQ17DRAFT_682475 [Cyathus striatus]|nr:hypothetical protein BDQ17DRAFT_682475 [Cyathus striatus]